MARQRGKKISSNQIKRLTADAVDQMSLPADVGLAIKSNLAVVTTLSEQIELLEKRLQANMAERSEYDLLTSMPGISRILATIILLETGPIERFSAVGNFASYARCVDSQHMMTEHRLTDQSRKLTPSPICHIFRSVRKVYSGQISIGFARRYCPNIRRQ
jgi:transposase